MASNAIADLAHFLAKAPVIRDSAEARLSFLDTVGCMIAGSQTHVVAATRQAACPPALKLATAAHALDFDDSELVGSTHPSGVIVAALLGLTRHKPLTFQAALDAYCAGFAAITFLGQMLGYRHYQTGWHSTATIGVFGAAAACARALGLGPQEFGHALSLAASQSAGLKAQFGSMAKPLQAGFAAQAGLQSACLSRAGTRASADIWSGFLALYSGDATFCPNLPGTLDIAAGAIARKPWPCCQYTFRALQAAIGFDLSARDIESITITGLAPYLNTVNVQEPQTPDAARFSLAWCVASAILDGSVTLESFSQQALDRGDIHTLARRITLAPRPAPVGTKDLSPAHPETVQVTLMDGSGMQAAGAHVPGGRQNPMTTDQLIGKFNACCLFADKRLTNAERFLDAPVSRPLIELPGVAALSH